MTAHKPSLKRKRSFYFKGILAEYFAALWLVFKGYRIIAMRYKTHSGEIDIIARQGDLAIFVEVKARANVQSGVDAVTETAKRRIQSASDIWMAKQTHYAQFSQRYDIIVILPWRFPVHFIDAF